MIGMAIQREQTEGVHSAPTVEEGSSYGVSLLVANI